MKRFVQGADRGQSTLLPECLDDWIDEENPVRVANANSKYAGWQIMRATLSDRIGAVQKDQGNISGAQESFRVSFNIRDSLAKADPSLEAGASAGIESWWPKAHRKIGNMLLVQRRGWRLAAIYSATVATKDVLENFDRDSVNQWGWVSQRHIEFGDSMLDQKTLPLALENYRTALGILERLAKVDPGNSEVQGDLFIAYERIGRILESQKNLAGALESYRAALAIADRLAKDEPRNAEWQRNLALSHGHFAMVLARQEEPMQALVAFRKGRAIIATLTAAAPSNATFPKDLDWFDGQISALEHAERRLNAGARASPSWIGGRRRPTRWNYLISTE